MTPVIGHYGGYRKTLSFGLTCLVYFFLIYLCQAYNVVIHLRLVCINATWYNSLVWQT